MQKALTKRDHKEVSASRAFRSQRDLICYLCHHPVFYIPEGLYVAHFRHKRANPDCDESVLDDGQRNSERAESRPAARFVLRRVSIDRAGTPVRQTVGNPWSLALRLPVVKIPNRKRGDTYRIRVGDGGRVDSRPVTEFDHPPIDVSIEPSNVTYGIVAVDGDRRRYEELLRIQGAKLRARGTFFQTTQSGISVATEHLRWSYTYDVVINGDLDLSHAGTIEIREIPTDRARAAYRTWSCYRIRLPYEPTRSEVNWIARTFEIEPDYPVVKVDLLWPHSIDEDDSGVRQLPQTDRIVIAATRRRPGPAFLHVLVDDRHALSTPVSAKVGKVSIFELSLANAPTEQTALAYGIDDRDESRDWWPVEYLDVRANRRAPQPGVVLFRFVNLTASDENIFALPSQDEPTLFDDVRASQATLQSVSLPVGARATLKYRHRKSTAWRTLRLNGETSIRDGARLAQRLTRYLADAHVGDICVAIAGYGSLLIEDKRTDLVTTSYTAPKWLRTAAFQSASLSLRNEMRRQRPLRAVRELALGDHPNAFTALARAELNRKRLRETGNK